MLGMSTRAYRVSERRPETQPTRTVSIYLTVDDFEYLDEVAAQQNISRSRAVANLIEKHRRNGGRKR